MRKLALQTLINKGACEEQVSLFQLHFQEEAEVTEISCAVMWDTFSWDWAGNKLLSTTLKKEYGRAGDSLREKHSQAKTRLWKKCSLAKDLLWEEHRRPKDLPLENYHRAISSLQEQYHRDLIPLWENYLRSQAQLWAKLYIQDVQTP